MKRIIIIFSAMLLVIFGISGCCKCLVQPKAITKQVKMEQTAKETSAPKQIETIIGEAETLFDGNLESRRVNIRLATEAVNNITVGAGEEFSFNSTVGDATEERGYQRGNVYVSKGSTTEIVQGVGGGICQVSSTLYMACKKAGLEIVERRPHTMAVTYCSREDEAAISYGNIDYKFKNNTKSPVIIEMKISTDDSQGLSKLSCQIVKKQTLN